MNRVPLLVFIALAGLFMAMLLGKQSASFLDSKEVKPFPTLAITSFDGGRKWSPLLLQHRVTLINFFASWCGPCGEEMPELVAMRKTFPELQTIGIVWNDNQARVEQWLKTHNNPFYSVWIDKTGAAFIDLGIRGIPESFIIDGAGNIRYRLPAVITPELRAETLDPLIKQLLAEESTHAQK